jgi:putative ABC transport system permease protein
MDTLLQDLRYSIRMLFRNAGYSIVAVMTLALGIGATSAVFSVVNAVLLRPLSYESPDRLVYIYENRLENEGNLSVPDYIDYRDQSQAFEQMAAFWSEDLNLSSGAVPDVVHGSFVTANFFSTLNVTPPLGRAFLPDEDKAGGSRVVVISDGFWKRRFGSNRSILGESILLNGTNFTVVGITPSDFQPLNIDEELWIPIDLDGSDALRLPTTLSHNNVRVRRLRFLTGVARLKPGVTVDQARAELDTLSRNLEQQYPDANTGWRAVAYPLQERIVGDVRPSLLIVLGAVGFLLLIACSNVANLMLARTVARGKEMAIRTALGASPLRVVRQLLTESMLLALVGGGLGLLLAYAGVDLLFTISRGIIPRLENVTIDGRVLAFTLVVALLTGLIFGLAPALYVSKPNLQAMLKEGRTSLTGGAGRQFIRNLFVVSEVSLALVLLVGAGLMVRSLQNLQKIDPGFDISKLQTMKIALSKAAYADDYQQIFFFQQLLDRIGRLPNVESSCAVDYLPLTGEGVMASFFIEGRAPLPSGEKFYASHSRISPEYFHTMRIPLLQGRYFSERDNKDAPRVAIINETMARLHFPNEDPIGRHLTLPMGAGPPVSLQVVGVVGDIKQFGLNADLVAQIYEPYLQRPAPNMRVVVRGISDSEILPPTLIGEVLEVDRNQPVSKIISMEDVLYDSVGQPRFAMLLLGIFAAVAMILAAIGIFGVMAYSVTQRRHEIGIRLALGAQRSHIFRLVVGQGLALTLLGEVIGLAIALVLTRLMSSMLFGLTATDPITFVMTAIALTTVALVACYIPAHRATRVDPKVALSNE